MTSALRFKTGDTYTVKTVCGLTLTGRCVWWTPESLELAFQSGRHVVLLVKVTAVRNHEVAA